MHTAKITVGQLTLHAVKVKSEPWDSFVVSATMPLNRLLRYTEPTQGLSAIGAPPSTPSIDTINWPAGPHHDRVRNLHFQGHLWSESVR